MYNTAIQKDISPLRQVHEAPVYYPTLEEFRNFPKFIEKIERDGSDRYGIVRVVPPLNWEYKSPRNLEEEILKKPIKPVKQYTSGRLGSFRVDLIESKKRTVEEYRENSLEKDIDVAKFLVFNQTLELYPYMDGNINIDLNQKVANKDNHNDHITAFNFTGNWAYNKKQYNDNLVGKFEYQISPSSSKNSLENGKYNWSNVPDDTKIEDIKAHKATGIFTTASGEVVRDEYDFYCIKIFHDTNNAFYYVLGQGQCNYGTYRLFGTLENKDISTVSNDKKKPSNSSESSNVDSKTSFSSKMTLSREYFTNNNNNNTKSNNGSSSTTTNNNNNYNIRDHLLMMKYQLSLRDETIVEKEFWRSINTLNKDIPMYGADQVGSIFKDQFANGWNVAKLDTILRIGLPEDMPGITRPMLYFGQYRAMFSWHKEDFDLNSINFIHHGKPKIWYAVCRPSAKRFESLCKSMFGDEANKCPEFMRHKNIFISPKLLKKEKIQYVTTVQHENEYILTFPDGYHAGFNTGFNVAESINFSSPKWVQYGRRCGFCRCFPYTFRMDIDHFCEKVRYLAPDRLPKTPEIGDRILIRWGNKNGNMPKDDKHRCDIDIQPGSYYLCRVKKGTRGSKFSVQGYHGGKTFLLPFDVNIDDWKWNCDGFIGAVKNSNKKKSMNNVGFKRMMSSSANSNKSSVKNKSDGEKVVKKNRTTLIVLKRKSVSKNMK